MDKQYTLPTAYQQIGMATLIEPVNDIIPASLVDESALLEEVNDEMSFPCI